MRWLFAGALCLVSLSCASSGVSASKRWEPYPGCGQAQCKEWYEACSADCINDQRASVTECENKCRAKMSSCEKSCG